MLNNKEATKMQHLLQNTKFLSHKGSIHLIKKKLNYSPFSALPHQPGTTNISFPFPHFLNSQTNPKCNISKPTKKQKDPGKIKFIPWNWKIRATTKRQVSRVPLPNPNHP